MSPRIMMVSEDAFCIYFDEAVSEKLLKKIICYKAAIEHEFTDGLIDVVPSYNTLSVVYDIHNTNLDALRAYITDIDCAEEPMELKHGKHVEIPVRYDRESGLDLESILTRCNLSLESFIDLHTGVVYRVYAVGFLPNFAYLGYLHKRLVIPRLSAPRAKVPAGSVAIAEHQTAVYPTDSAGGWNIVGSTHLDMSKMQLAVNDTVRFVSI